jgi:hypothetical protein
MHKFEKDLMYSYPTGEVPMGNDAMLDKTNPTPTYTPVTRGSALSGIKNRIGITPQSRASLGNVQQLDPLVKRRSELEGQLAMVDEEMTNLVNEIERQKQHRVDVDNLIKQYVQWIKDYDNKGDLYKVSHPSERKGYERKRDLYVQEFDATTQQINSLTDKYNNELIPKRKAIADELASLGVPKSKLGGRSLRDRLDRMESRGDMSVANKVVEDVATNVTDALQNLPGIGGMFGGGGGGGAMGGGEDQTQGASKSFFDENKIPIFVLGGSLAFLILNK